MRSMLLTRLKSYGAPLSCLNISFKRLNLCLCLLDNIFVQKLFLLDTKYWHVKKRVLHSLKGHKTIEIITFFFLTYILKLMKRDKKNLTFFLKMYSFFPRPKLHPCTIYIDHLHNFSYTSAQPTPHPPAHSLSLTLSGSSSSSNFFVVDVISSIFRQKSIHSDGNNMNWFYQAKVYYYLL